ncbi:hypothetical protein K1T71_003490 [Dendrolimus kikuchii]|uniref:Uncharacterized protein n=1 Tax=Dendrolimus kikuchii TaxID=765133 RepID=A0ACC1DC51_9NEOP|nr:hypothetical protein K1T71_003490 [Dendrolimus kikuchii]
MGHKYLRKNITFWIPMSKSRSKSTFQVSFRSTLFIGQIFSLIPVLGVFSNNVDDVRFVLTSWKCVYGFVSLLGQFFVVIMTTINLFHLNTTIAGTAQVIYCAAACITIVMFFQIAKSWPNLVQHIAHTLTMKCNVTCAIVLFLTLVQHILSLFLAFAGSSIYYHQYTFYEGFVRYFYPWLFNYVPYSPVLGVLIQCLQIQGTFIWNFADMFIICMSFYLTSRLNHVNKKLLAAQGKYLPETFWRGRREDYGRTTQLVRKFDEVISGIIFITFTNNLFSICYQLYNTLEYAFNYGIKGTEEYSNHDQRISLLGGYEAVVFYSYSLVFLIVRSTAVSLIASEVNSASMVPAPILYDVPSPVYGVEVQRFLDQVNGEKVALSGLQFFSITRGLLLNIAGTIVTYELVMFQFNIPYSADNSTI